MDEQTQPPLSTPKSNLEIHIGGILFHVETSAYTSLKNYLQDLKRCFRPDSLIIEDLEVRIAEVLLERITATKPTIDNNDVELMILQVGTAKEIALAEGIDLDLGYFERKVQWQELKKASPKKVSRQNSRKLTIVKENKKIAGVASGIAAHYNTDPVWVRIGLIASLFIGGGVGLPLYFILWAAMPNQKLEEKKESRLTRIKKRLMRSSTDKKVAGVASGIAKYFGIDETLVRIIFGGLALFKGFGLIAYLVMWAAMPSVKTLSDQIELEEEPSFLEEESFKNGVASVEAEIQSTVKKMRNINKRF